MLTERPFTLESRSIEALPLVNHLLARLRLGDLLAQHVPAGDRRQRLAPAKALGVLVRNLLLARVPLYSQPAWAARAVPSLLGLLPAEVARLTDDQVGRALDRLFDADRATLLTQVVVRAVSTSGRSHPNLFARELFLTGPERKCPPLDGIDIQSGT